jgi:hypothetical protein
VLVELGVVEQRYDAVKEVLDGAGTRDRGRPPQRRDVPEPAQLAAALPGARDGRPGRSIQASEDLPAPHAPRAEVRVIELRREHPRCGAETPRLRARPQGRRPGALPLEHLPDPPPAHCGPLAHDHGQDRAVPPHPSRRAALDEDLRLHRRGYSARSLTTSPPTTRSGLTRRSRWPHPSSGSAWPVRRRPRSPARARTSRRAM